MIFKALVASFNVSKAPFSSFLTLVIQFNKLSFHFFNKTIRISSKNQKAFFVIVTQEAAKSMLRASLRRRLSAMDRQNSRQVQTLQRRTFFEAAALQVNTLSIPDWRQACIKKERERERERGN